MKSLPVSHVVPRVPALPWLSHARRPCTGGVGRPDKVRVISPNKLQFSPPPSDDDLSTALEEDGATQEVAVPSSLDVNPDQLPKHVAIVMDGNVRWAQQRGLAAVSGHQAGVQSLRAAVTCCKQWGIPCLTVFAFSAENWQREEAEVSFLLALIERVLQRELPALVGQGVRMRFIGEVGLLPRSLQAACRAAELATGDNCDVHLTVALSYSSRQDICTAVQDIAHLIAQGEIKPCEVTPSLIASHLSTRQLPTALQEPDLVIRTSGEQRLSNFLLWESAYSELYFAPVCWPDFGEQQFAAAMMDFAARERRFGRRH